MHFQVLFECYSDCATDHTSIENIFTEHEIGQFYIHTL